MADDIPRKVYELHPWKGKEVMDGKVTFETTLGCKRETKQGDAAFHEWLTSTIRRDEVGHPLCVGARIAMAEDGSATLTIDESLPDGEWVVTYADGKVHRLYGVYGPVRSQSLAEHDEDIEVSPVALTFETRE